MSAEHEGPAGGRKGDGGKKPAAKPPRVGSSLTDAVVAALAKVDDKKDDDKKDKEDGASAAPPAAPEAGCAATAAAAKEPPPVVGGAAVPAPVVAAAPGGANGFRSGAGSFADLARRWAGGAPLTPAVSPPAQEPAPVPPTPDLAASPPTAAAEPAASAPPEPVRPEPVPPEPASESAAPAAAAPAAQPAGAPVSVRYFGRTDVGLVREHNEDNFLVLDLTANLRGADAPREVEVGARGLVLAVCDGMGGAAAGEVASQMAVDTIHEIFTKGDPPPDRDAFARRLVHAIEEAGHRIFSAAKMDRSRRGMGTTTTLAGLVDNVLFVGQVGDSRAYVLRGDRLELITKDQSLVNQLIEAGQLTEEEAEAFEHSNIILQALGTTEEVTVDLTFLELRRGDRLLMCSDGLSGLVHADMIKEVLVAERGLGDAAAKLIQMANAGGGHDNITVIVADFDGEGLADAADAQVHYQQYPLPPDDSARAPSAPPREPSMKAGGPKPGADVKRDELGDATVASPEGGGGKALMILVAVVVVVVLAVAAYFAFGTGGDDAASDAAPPPVTTTQPQPRPVAPPDPVVEPSPDPSPAPAAETGTVRVSTDVEDGTLWINGEDRGPLADGRTVELPPGAHRLEVRSGDATIVEGTVQVTAGAMATVTLDQPVVPDAPPDIEEPPPPPQQANAPGEERGPTKVRPPRDRPPRNNPNGLPDNPFR